MAKKNRKKPIANSQDQNKKKSVANSQNPNKGKETTNSQNSNKKKSVANSQNPNKKKPTTNSQDQNKKKSVANSQNKNKSTTNSQDQNKKKPVANSQNPNKGKETTNSQYSNKKKTVANSQNLNKKEQTTNSQNSNKKKSATNSQNPNKKKPPTNSQYSNKKKSVANSQNPNEKKETANSQYSNKKKETTNSQNSNKKKSVANSQNPNKEKETTNSQNPNKKKPPSNNQNPTGKPKAANNRKSNKKKLHTKSNNSEQNQFKTISTDELTRLIYQNKICWESEYNGYNYNIEKNVQPRGYQEIYPPIDFPLNGCGFGDEYFIFDGASGSPKYEDTSGPWDKFIQWMETVCERLRSSENFEDKCEYKIGQKIIKYAKQHNSYHIYMLMKIEWVSFRDTYLLVDDCPEHILEFVRGIMYEKMTERQMWGTDEDRLPEGTVIIFDKDYMPKEGEDTGKLKFEYRPNYIEEMMATMRNGNMR